MNAVSMKQNPVTTSIQYRVPRGAIVPILALLVALPTAVFSQNNDATKNQERGSIGNDEFPIWPGAAPGSEDWTRKEIITGSGEQTRVRNVSRPSLTPFLPKPGNANGTAVVVAPGGAFRFLSWENEGTKVAEWLAERGVTAFVLKYRMIDTGSTDADFQKSMQELVQSMNAPGGPFEHPETKQVAELAAEDGRQAIRVLRQQADKWGIDPNRIGFIGFSAGAVVATRASSKYDAESRPNFVAAIYGAPMREYEVPADAPPLFVLFAKDDGIGVQATELHKKWKDAGKAAELIDFESGSHGFGMSKRGRPTDNWIERFGDWLATRGFMGSAAATGANAEQEIISLSKQKWQWMSERKVESLAALFHEKAVFVHMGATMSRDQELDTIRTKGIVYKEVDIQEASVRIIDSTAIVLNKIRLVAVVGGNEVTNPFVVTEVYVRQGGTWKLTSLSFTRLLGR